MGICTWIIMGLAVYVAIAAIALIIDMYMCKKFDK
jgi:hypothetical protein